MQNKKRLFIHLVLTGLITVAGFIGVPNFSLLLAGITAPILFYFIHFISVENVRSLFRLKMFTHMGIIFLLVLAFPYLDELFGVNRHMKLFKLQEKRFMAPKPEFNWANNLDYFHAYTPYYNDHFRFRKQLIYLNNFLKIEYFNVSPLPMVVLGKEGFLFFAKERETLDAVEYFRSIKPFSSNQLTHWRNVLQERKDWLARQGIKYLVLIVPNKSTIYPEFMPDYIHKASGRSRMDQLMEYMSLHSTVPMLDLRPALLTAKKRIRIYHKTDSHWNEYGAYVAYRELITHLPDNQIQGTPLPENAFQLNIRNRMGGDLAILLFMQKRMMREDRIMMDPQKPPRFRKVKTTAHPYAIIAKTTINPAGDLPGALMVHDSFGEGIMRYLSENFRRITYVFDWKLNFYPALIESEKPKIVIEEFAERFLMDMDLSNPF